MCGGGGGRKLAALVKKLGLCTLKIQRPGCNLYCVSRNGLVPQMALGNPEMC